MPNLIDGWSLRLRFADPEVERAYIAEISSEALHRIKLFVRKINIIYVASILTIQIFDYVLLQVLYMGLYVVLQYFIFLH